MPYEYLKIEKGDGIAVVILDRPPVNSLNAKAYQEIHDAFCECEQDDSIRAPSSSRERERRYSLPASM
jgi:enoyl-CoA hydratase